MFFGSVSVRSNFGEILRVVLIFLQLFESGGHGGYAVGGNFLLGDPADGVEHDLSEIVVLPVVVEVSAGESESAAAILVFRYPHHVLEVAISDCRSGVWGGIVMMVLLGNHIERRHGG